MSRTHSSPYRKKLIEVALPLDAINKESAREKSIRHGHPSTLHLWWARRPLAACRAVLFSSLVNDPGDDPMYGISEDIAATERAKLFDLIEELVKWENSNNPRVINAARLEIARSIAANKVADGELEDDTPLVADAPSLPEEQEKYLPDPPPEYTAHDVRFKMPGLKPEQVNHFLAHYAPPVLDPFAGGGSIPLEAQRLGLRAYASDLNPVAVLINKAMIEIPPKFANMPPVNPEWQGKSDEEKAMTTWNGAQGLAADVRYYGKWMRDEAEKRIGHLYPKVKVTEEMAADRPDLEPYVGQELTVIAWLWARTVKSPNPAAGGKHVPLLRSFWLSKRKGNEVFVEPVVDSKSQQYGFTVRKGTPSDDFDPGKGTVGRLGGECVLTGTPIPLDYVREQGQENALSYRMIAIAAEGVRKRVYLPPIPEHEEAANSAVPSWQPDTSLPDKALGFRVQKYGIDKHHKLFSPRQLTAMDAFSSIIVDVIADVRERCDDHVSNEYPEAVGLHLAFLVSKLADMANAFCAWEPLAQCPRHLFGKQTISMVWDFAEGNPFSSSSGSWDVLVKNQLGSLESPLMAHDRPVAGTARQHDIANPVTFVSGPVISTDPPYYDNIGYADLSDFFFVWLRRSLSESYPELFSTLLTPKTPELIATPFRHDGDSAAAKEHFESGLTKAVRNMRDNTATDAPITIYYAFKQSEGDESGEASTGWETMLQAVIGVGLAITGTWPVRTENASRLRGQGSNALASSVVLVCRLRLEDASMVTRRDFANALRKELPGAIKHLQSGNIAPVDLAQASIGPGMAVFSRYRKVVNADGSPMSVREALQLINQVLDEALAEHESDYDSETRFALRWFEQYGMQEGPFGDAETLAKAMAVSVNGVAEAGILEAGAGKVRLLKRDELPDDWDPMTDSRLVVWEVTQYLIRTLEQDGEMAAAELLGKVGSLADIARDLAYRLYATCERKKWAQEALAYNSLVIAWPEILKLARQIQPEAETQQEMF